MTDQKSTLAIELAAAEAEVDVETYWETMRACDRELDGPCPTSVSRDAHARVMLSLSLPPPPL